MEKRKFLTEKQLRKVIKSSIKESGYIEYLKEKFKKR